MTIKWKVISLMAVGFVGACAVVIRAETWRGPEVRQGATLSHPSALDDLYRAALASVRKHDNGDLPQGP